MTKNELIKVLQQWEGNPKVVFYDEYKYVEVTHVTELMMTDEFEMVDINAEEGDELIWLENIIPITTQDNPNVKH